MYELNNLNYRTTYYGIYTGQLGFVLYKCLYYKLVFFEPLNTAERKNFTGNALL